MKYVIINAFCNLLQVWVDWKCYIKKKLVANKKEIAATGGGNCRLQRINPTELEVINLVDLNTSTSGIAGAVAFRLPQQSPEDENLPMTPVEGIEETASDGDVHAVRRQRRAVMMRKENIASALLREQMEEQKRFYAKMEEYRLYKRTTLDEISSHLKGINKELEDIASCNQKQFLAQCQHNRFKEELLKQKVEIKLKALKIEHPDVFE